MKKDVSRNPARGVSVVDQTCAYIRAQASSGVWGGRPPSVRAIAAQFGVAPNTVMSALRRLERDGVLIGRGRERRFAPEIVRGDSGAPGRMRVGVLCEKPAAGHAWRENQWMGALRTFLEKEGHEVVWVELPPSKLERPEEYVAPPVREAGARAWILARCVRRTMEWFLDAGVPALSFGGHRIARPMDMVGVDAYAAIRAAISRLIGLGHRRMVFITPGVWRKPEPGRMVNIFREELSSVGVTAGEYHLPDWDETPAGLDALLRQFFRFTPPTAILCVDPEHALGVLSWLAAQGLRVPHDVSLVSAVDHPAFRWVTPRPACCPSDRAKLMRHVRHWLSEVPKGRRAPRERSVLATFEEGGSLGPPVSEGRIATISRA